MNELMNFSAQQHWLSDRGWLLASLCFAVPVAAQSPAKRMILPVRWTQVGTFTDNPDNPILQNPLVITAPAANRIVVIDYGDWTIKSLSSSGKLLWTYGRRGAGPGEIGAPADVTSGSNGEVYVTDRGNARVYVLSSTGTLLRAITFAKSIERTSALSNGDLLIAGPLDSALTIYSPDGKTVRRRLTMPIDAKASPFVRDLNLAAGVDGQFFAAFTNSSLLVKGTTAGPLIAAQGPDHLPFAEMKIQPGGRVDADPSRARVSVAIAATPTHLLVLTGGNVAGGAHDAKGDDDFSDLVDLFDGKTLAYTGTWKLPTRARYIAWHDGVLSILSREPEPRITFWKLDGAARH